MRLKWLLVMPLVVLSLSVSAGPLDEAKGKAHLDAVAAGDIDTLMRDYAEDAYMDWIGGPLDGRYRGKAAIRAVWEKFIAANSGQPRPVKRSEIEPYTNPKGVSLEASAEYGGKTPVKVWHVMVYRDGEMTSEIWQVAPAIKVGP